VKLVVHLDAVRDLPKVHAKLDTLLATIQNQDCSYHSPCAIGAMIDDRNLLARLDWSTDDTGRTGTEACFLRFKTTEQMDDLLCLQHDFDTSHVNTFLSTLKELEEKCLSLPPPKRYVREAGMPSNVELV
jgi:hypothetical protein